MLNHLKKLDWILVILVLLLCAVGLLSIYSTSQAGFNFKKQLSFVILGLFLMLILSFFDYRLLKNRTFIIILLYCLSLGLLAAVLLLSQPIRGAMSWLRVGLISFQPVELTKIVLILLLAKYFSIRHIEMYRIRHIIASGVYIGLPISVILLQPDLGSVIILLAIWLGIMLIAGIKLRHLIILSLIALLIITASWFWLLKDYQKQRILAFINPQIDPLGHGYNVVQSLIAIGSGQFWGRGLGQGPQTQLKFLPEEQTDFIFATIAEEFGFLGICFALFLFTLLIWRVIKIALGASNNFSRLFASGLAIMLFVQIFINIGMNMALLPITGLTLPLISYGGSSLVTIFLGLGILQSIKVRS